MNAFVECAVIPQQAVDAISRGLVPPDLPEKEQVVVRYVLELNSRASVSDETFAELQDHWSPREIADLSIVAAHYLAVGTLCKAWTIEFDSEEMKESALTWQYAKDEEH